jgi:hypothetical protein
MDSRLETESTTRGTDEKALRNRIPGLRLGAVLAIAVAVAVAAFFLLREDEEEPQSSPPAAVAANAPEAVTLAALRRRADQLDMPVYWAGRLPGRKYELTETPDGSRIYVRYLPANARVGAQRPFLTVATYRMSNAFEATKAVSTVAGSRTLEVPDGGIAFYAADHPTSVYLAFPDANYQIEVFHPRPEIVRRVVRSGQIRPIGAG